MPDLQVRLVELDLDDVLVGRRFARGVVLRRLRLRREVQAIGEGIVVDPDGEAEHDLGGLVVVVLAAAQVETQAIRARRNRQAGRTVDIDDVAGLIDQHPLPHARIGARRSHRSMGPRAGCAIGIRIAHIEHRFWQEGIELEVLEVTRAQLVGQLVGDGVARADATGSISRGAIDADDLQRQAAAGDLDVGVGGVLHLVALRPVRPNHRAGDHGSGGQVVAVSDLRIAGGHRRIEGVVDGRLVDDPAVGAAQVVAVEFTAAQNALRDVA